jgi:hypothetical protein
MVRVENEKRGGGRSGAVKLSCFFASFQVFH